MMDTARKRAALRRRPHLLATAGDDLSSEEIDYLREASKTLGQVIPQSIKNKLFELGYLEQGLGGLKVTYKGNSALIKRPPTLLG
ncbi:MAG: hypothetical protein AAF569_00615 [Pseudomonadota bacterium]